MALLSTLAKNLEMAVSRDSVLELLWPEQCSERSTISSHSLIYSLHSRLSRDQLEALTGVYANGSCALNRAA